MASSVIWQSPLVSSAIIAVWPSVDTGHARTAHYDDPNRSIRSDLGERVTVEAGVLSSEY